MDTTLSLYRIFYTVAQCGSISAAARHLYISQPAISKSISNLENELQTHLFERTSRGVSLTEEGQLLFHHVSDAFHSLEAGEAELSAFAIWVLDTLPSASAQHSAGTVCCLI